MVHPIKAYSPLIWVSLAGFIYAISLGAMWFILPIFASVRFGADLSLVSLLMAIPYFGSLIFDLPMGTLSDYVGRKRAIIVGLILLAPLGLLLPYVTSLELFVVFAIIFGLLSTLVLPIARALIMDLCPPKKAAEYFGLTLGVMTLGGAIGPLASGMLLESSFEAGLPSVMLVYIIFGLVAVLPLLFVKETVKEKQSLFSGLKKVAKQGLFLPAIREFGALKKMGLMVIYVSLILTIIDSIIWTYEPLIGEKGLSADFIGSLLFVFTFSLVIFQIAGGFIAEKLGKMKVLMIGLILAGVFMALFSFQTDETMLMLTALLTSLGLAFAWPAVSGVITEVSVNRQRGSIAGVWNFFMDLAYLIGPVLGGVIATFSTGVSTIFLAMGGLLIISTLPLLIIKH